MAARSTDEACDAPRRPTAEFTSRRASPCVRGRSPLGGSRVSAKDGPRGWPASTPRPARLFLAVSAARVLGRRVKRHYVRGIFPRRTAKVTSYIRVIGWTLLVVTVVHGHATGRWSELHGPAMVLASASIVGAEVR